MNRSRFLFCTLAIALSGCEYRETVGRNVPADAAACEGFSIPAGDCTLAQTSCNFDTDCPDIASTCNGTVDRCFSSAANCVGTSCTFDSDCPVAERCNGATRSCYAVASSQSCMPCNNDPDCGSQTCTLPNFICR